MTVIAWDGHTLAADKRIVNMGLIQTTTKIFRIEGALVGSAGNLPLIREMIAWYTAGAKASDFPQSLRDKEEWPGLLVIRAGKPILKYEQTPYPFEIEDTRVALGSGRDFALAAMHCGRTASEAVQVACVFENGCGNGVDTLTLEQDQ